MNRTLRCMKRGTAQYSTLQCNMAQHSTSWQRIFVENVLPKRKQRWIIRLLGGTFGIPIVYPSIVYPYDMLPEK
ncbi:hypothetical protein POVCU2_0026910 [Plasmodium ovale curtisi]|uniref:Uncharacterized protein n=1 Tax=Plasmodium ovale curtisi TaxID=864141 RepID=A0A1A8VYZ4_PLAOA|nr:hypothetical protein POVCU2_0026910 [Plasmodium ovale curtisi]SBS93092.1 hypothetical protein POVCU1_024660 [Plasmodium ovale curtisi]